MFWPASLATSTFVEAKTPGKTYCFVGKCHRVRTLGETQGLVGKTIMLRTSHYDDPRRDRFNPSNLTSSGEWFRAGAPDNAASPNLPNGTIILAFNPTTRKAAVLRINNAGPYWGNRTLDVSKAAAQRLGFAGQGVSTLAVKVLRAPSSAEATYSKGRRYAAVPGYIGTHSSLESAVADARRRMGGSAPSAPAVAPSTTVVAAAPPKPTAAPVVAAAPQAPAARARTISAPRIASRNIDVGGASPVASARPSRTTVGGNRPTMDQNGYFTVDCRSMPGLCGSSGRSGARGSSFRTSDASSSNRP